MQSTCQSYPETTKKTWIFKVTLLQNISLVAKTKKKST